MTHLFSISACVWCNKEELKTIWKHKTHAMINPSMFNCTHSSGCFEILANTINSLRKYPIAFIRKAFSFFWEMGRRCNKFSILKFKFFIQYLDWRELLSCVAGGLNVKRESFFSPLHEKNNATNHRRTEFCQQWQSILWTWSISPMTLWVYIVIIFFFASVKGCLVQKLFETIPLFSAR